VTTPPQEPPVPPVPPGYQPGDYVPYKDRDPANPAAVAGTWADPARQAQLTGTTGGRPMTAEEQYRAIYGLDAPSRVVLASWGLRVLGYLVDLLFAIVASLPFAAGWVMMTSEVEFVTDPVTGETTTAPGSGVSGATVGMLALGVAVIVAFNLWNMVFRQGRTGYTLGKTVVGIRLVREATMRPPGAGRCFLRLLAHYVDNLVCYLGWFWPLWDHKKQTLADKIVGTVVLVQPSDSAR
jgi:uncharacterized RDD family membrane protein YckC